MFNNNRIKKLENEVLNLQGKVLDMERELQVQTHIYFREPSDYYLLLDSIKKVSISTVLEDLIRKLGYEITYNHTPETTSYTLEKQIIPETVPKMSKLPKKQKKAKT